MKKKVNPLKALLAEMPQSPIKKKATPKATAKKNPLNVPMDMAPTKKKTPTAQEKFYASTGKKTTKKETTKGAK